MTYPYYKRGPTNVLFCTLKLPVNADSSVQIKTKAECIPLSVNVPDKTVLKGRNEMVSM